jgi:mRNA interferase MazF
MLRGEVWWVDFDPSLGGEIQKTHPAVIVSNDASNRNLNRVQVVPITSNVTRVYPCEAPIDLNGELSARLNEPSACNSASQPNKPARSSRA